MTDPLSIAARWTGVDIIGDVHGYADKLERLLASMDYREIDGVWAHPSRGAIFVGDLIDRGPFQADSVRIARQMVEAGTALIVMGNHEFNAIAWATAHPSCPGDHLRTRKGASGVRHRRQHEAFLNEVGEDSATHHDIVDWFRTLPLWLDLGDLRVVHACWDRAAMERLAAAGLRVATLDNELLVAASTRDTEAFRAVEHIVKGPEVDLPNGQSFVDAYGNLRTRARFSWWDPAAAEVEFPPCAVYREAIPVFFGHYWHKGSPAPLGDHVACVDYSAGAGRNLVAYRWSGESRLSADAFVAQD